MPGIMQEHAAVFKPGHDGEMADVIFGFTIIDQDGNILLHIAFDVRKLRVPDDHGAKSFLFGDRDQRRTARAISGARF